MGLIQAQRYCKLCGHRTLHARSTFSDGMGCLLSILTLGLFVPVWVLIKVSEALFGRWRCQLCGQGRIT